MIHTAASFVEKQAAFEAALATCRAIAYLRRNIMADTIREKIEDAGQAAKDAAKKAGEKIKEGAETVAEKAGNAAHSVGQAVKDAGQKLKDKSGS